jgi:hypothetical protein
MVNTTLPGTPFGGPWKTETAGAFARGDLGDCEMDRGAAAGGKLNASQPPVALASAQNSVMKWQNTTKLGTDPNGP